MQQFESLQFIKLTPHYLPCFDENEMDSNQDPPITVFEDERHYVQKYVRSALSYVAECWAMESGGCEKNEIYRNENASYDLWQNGERLIKKRGDS